MRKLKIERLKDDVYVMTKPSTVMKRKEFYSDEFVYKTLDSKYRYCRGVKKLYYYNTAEHVLVWFNLKPKTCHSKIRMYDKVILSNVPVMILTNKELINNEPR